MPAIRTAAHSAARFAAVCVCLPLCLCLVMLTGCGDRGEGGRVPNIPPETVIVSGPTGESPTHFEASVYWYGTDADGYVDRFLVKTVKGADETDFPPGFDWDSLEGWGETASNESTFTLPADSCCAGTGNSVAALSYWGILVRAVDNEGAASPEPATIFFQARNVIPRVKITSPHKLPIAYITVPPNPFLAWEGVDPDGEDEKIQYKYIVLPEADLNPQRPRLPPLSQVKPNDPEAGHVAAPIGYWSEWVPSDCTYVWDVDLSAYRATGESVVVYVTAKDQAGATLLEKLYGSYNGGLNWVRLMVVGTGTGVPCMIDGGPLGRRDSNNPTENRSMVTDVFLGAEISFRFWGSENPVRGEIAEAYRYYWDSPHLPSSSWDFWTSTRPIRQAGLSPQWMVSYPWSGSLTPALGEHVLVVRLIDRNKTETECQFRIDVIEGPRTAPGQKILLVDDNEAHWQEQRWVGFGEAQDSLWTDILAGYEYEVLDTGPTYGNRVPVRFVGGATTVIWLVDQDDSTIPGTALLDCCTSLGNYLYSYVRVGGNLIIMGKNPVYACGFWPDGYPDPRWRGYYTTWAFDPDVRTASSDTTNFMWEVFGIRKMQLSKVHFTAVWPCPGCEGTVRDTIELNSYAVHIDNLFEKAMYITDLRDDMDVRPLLSTAIKDGSGNWVDSERGPDPNYIAVYVPGNSRRGHAAYIGFPEFWFDHAKIKTMVRQLLDEFGEQTDR